MSYPINFPNNPVRWLSFFLLYWRNFWGSEMFDKLPNLTENDMVEQEWDTDPSDSRWTVPCGFKGFKNQNATLHKGTSHWMKFHSLLSVWSPSDWEWKETSESLRCLSIPGFLSFWESLHSEVGADVLNDCWVSHGLKEALFIFF